MEKCTKEIRIGYRKKRSIVSVFREHYIRDDISCKVEGCHFCEQTNKRETPPYQLSSDASHYVIPDAQVLADYLEVFEQPNITGIILSQTALSWIRSKVGRRTQEKAIRLARTPSKNSVVFSNEHHVETIAARIAHESEKEWQKRLTIRLGVWYVNHLGVSRISTPIVVVSNEGQGDYLNVNAEGLLVMNMADYLQHFWPNSKDTFSLYESLSSALQTTPESVNKQLYTDHFSAHIIEDGLRTGDIFAGMLRVNRYNARDKAFVTPRLRTVREQDSELTRQGDVLIQGSSYRNRAIHGDIVAVKLLPRGEWMIHPEGSTASHRNERIPTGMVVGVLQRTDREYIASFNDGGRSSHGKMEKVLVYPYDIRIPKIRIATRQFEELQHHRIVVRIDSWEPGSQYPNGHFVRSIGPIGDLETETSVILTEHELVTTPFSKALLNELPTNSVEQPWSVADDEVLNRRDLRCSHLIFSIDPEGCEDVDDTLSVRHLKHGGVELGVHIADVSHFVKPESLTDHEARNRSTTVYLADRRYDMLPAMLSADVCSLWSEVDRYAVSVIWRLDAHYHVKSVWYGRTVIRSRYKLSYETAQSLYDGALYEEITQEIPELCKQVEDKAKMNFEELRSAITSLVEIARELRHRRASQGGLELEGVEVRVQLNDKDKSQIEDLIPKKPLEMHETIAECMIFANQWVAKKLCERFPSQALLRHHPPPTQEKFAALIACAKARGFNIVTTDNKTLAGSLDASVDSSNPNVNKILRYLATQAMSQAQYFSSGTLPQHEHFHYGLALESYTHFTSPIRRYADLVVHRQLLAAVSDHSAKCDLLPSNTVLDKMAQHMNTKHRSSQLAQIASVQLFQCLYFSSHQTQSTDRGALSEDRSRCDVTGTVIRITENGIVVFVARYGITSTIYLRDKNGQVLQPIKSIYDDTSATSFGTGSVKKTENDITVLHSNGEYTFMLLDNIKVRVVIEKSHAHGSSLTLKLISYGPVSASGLAEVTPHKTGHTEKKELIKIVQEQEAIKHQSSELLVNTKYKQSDTTSTLYSLFQDMTRMAITEK